MALISDAAHNFSDVLALGFSWIAILLSQRKPSLKFTYGFRRSTILIALLNTILLLATVVYIAFETIHRISVPVEIKSGVVIFVASGGILINGITAWLFSRLRRNDLNIRSVFLHFAADTLVSAGVVLSGIVIAVTRIRWIDSAVSLAIVGVILFTTYNLLIRTINLALDAVPENIDINAVRKYLEGIPQVKGVHDLHIWALGTSDTAITVHLATNAPTDSNFISVIQNHLNERFSIGHSTIQVEYGESPEGCNDCN
jgi:cobalt-zinc-cadmium efflux system protein